MTSAADDRRAGAAGTAQPGPWDEPQPTSTERTLVVDVGGTGLKAAVLDGDGEMLAERVRVRTTYPCPPELLVERITELARGLGPFERAAVGFPGMVRSGTVLSAPKFNTLDGPGSAVDPGLEARWHRFPLADSLSELLGVPVRVANDADVAGGAVIEGTGLELVLTLGTGFGTAAFYDGVLLPHYEFAHHSFRKDQTYEEQLGEPARSAVGEERWVKRVRKAISSLRALTFFDRCYVGGGNAKRLPGDLGADVVLVDNLAGLRGGMALWHERRANP